MQVQRGTPSAKIELVEHYAIPVENGLQIRSATHSALLSGRLVRSLFPRLLPLLDGTRTEEQVATELTGTVTPAQVGQILEFLRQKRMIREVEPVPQEIADEDPNTYESLARFFGRRGSRYTALTALRKANVGVINGGPVLPALVQSLNHVGVNRFCVLGTDSLDTLEAQQSRFYGSDDANQKRSSLLKHRVLNGRPGVQMHVEDKRAEDIQDWEEAIRDLSMVVVLIQGPILFHPWLEKLNAAALSLRVPWTTVALLDGDSVHVGPTIRPGITACYKCFELRLKSNVARLDSAQAFEAHVQRTSERIDFGFFPPVADIVSGLAAVEVVRTLSPDSVARTSGKLMVFNLSDLSTSLHPVLKLPRCPACSPVRNMPRERVWS